MRHTWFKLWFMNDEVFVDNSDPVVDEYDGNWTRSTMLVTRANKTTNNTINNENIIHFLHFVFPDLPGIVVFLFVVLESMFLAVHELWSVFDVNGGKVAKVSNFDGSGWDRWEITTAEWGLRLDFFPWFCFLWRSAVCELVDNPEDVDTDDFADDTASYKDWSNALLYASMVYPWFFVFM